MTVKTATLSCTIPEDLSEKLNLISSIEERSKSYYVKKALQEFLSERLENALLAEIGDSAYKKYLESKEKGIDYDEVRKELGLNDK
ncbi:ribbon-helix-helix domain-containing protein [Rickettsiales bacterium]|nr:ribbon-helix-helix domain-containing protein [Rickettsiales bacterium]